MAVIVVVVVVVVELFGCTVSIVS